MPPHKLRRATLEISTQELWSIPALFRLLERVADKHKLEISPEGCTLRFELEWFEGSGDMVDFSDELHKRCVFIDGVKSHGAE